MIILFGFMWTNIDVKENQADCDIFAPSHIKKARDLSFVLEGVQSLEFY